MHRQFKIFSYNFVKFNNKIVKSHTKILYIYDWRTEKKIIIVEILLKSSFYNIESRHFKIEPKSCKINSILN